MSSPRHLDSSYESIPYRSQPFSFTHPQHLRALGILFGMSPAPADDARVLEIGCGGGQNILPLAALYPRADFLGIDSSPAAVREAVEWKDVLALKNIEFQQCDVRELADDIGSFDYIICHGVFSWVPEEVRASILEICRARLRPQGIAYISYNTYPGWHTREMLRNMLLFHAEQFSEPQTSLTQARAIAGFYRKALSKFDAPLSRYLTNMLESVRQQPDWYLRHDVLEELNCSFYFHQFVRLAQDAGLQYLADAELRTMVDADLDEDVRAALNKLASDRVRLEQYLDFLRNCGFRRSLLCKQNITLSPERFLERLQKLHLASPLVPDPAEAGVFTGPGEARIDARELLLRWALEKLHAHWPGSVSFTDLLREAQQQRAHHGGAAQKEEEDRVELAAGLWQLATVGLLELRSEELVVNPAPSAAPSAPAYLRLQAAQGDEVTNVRHELVSLDSLSRLLITSCDGATTREELLELVEEWLASERPDSGDSAAALLEETLSQLAKAALLTG